MRKFPLGSLASLFVAALALAAPLGATSYVMMSDAALHSQAAVIAQVEVLTVSPAPILGTPSTDSIVLVERLLKGEVSGTTIVVRVPGGSRPDGMVLQVFGAPEFGEGDRAIVFLNPRADGTYGVLHMMLGSFLEREVLGSRMALRNLEGTLELGRAEDATERGVRDFDRFADWLADRSRGIVRARDYLVGDDSTASHAAQATLIRGPKNKPIRFFEFDDGGKVVWRQARGLAGARRPFRAALKAWTQDPDTIVDLKFGGRTPSKTGFGTTDGVNALIFEDPNFEIEGSFSCFFGGVIAVGGPWFNGRFPAIKKIPAKIGKGKANVAVEADIITNDGTKCLFKGDRKAKEQVFGHELGHTLGIGHICGDDGSGDCDTPAKRNALMRATFHRDGRGADLTDLDRAFLDKLY